MKYNFKQETPTAKLPTRHTAVSAGVDFYADNTVNILPGNSAVVSTGISWQPSGSEIVCLIIQSRSGLAFREGIEASNAGVIDQDYNGAVIHVKLYNNGAQMRTICRGDKICQGIPQIVPHFEDVESLDDSRNGLGFGSSDGKG